MHIGTSHNRFRKLLVRYEKKSKNYLALIYRKDNIKAGLIQARDSGTIFGRKIHTVNETIFDSITEASAYWIGFLMADGNVHNAKHGSPIIRLALGAKDRDHILKFAQFTGSTHKVISTYTICRGNSPTCSSIRMMCFKMTLIAK
jgi:DNA-binding transcriptional regulator WhiA